MISFFVKLLLFATRARFRGDRRSEQFARSLLWESSARLDRYRESGPLMLPSVQLADLIGESELTLQLSSLRHEDGRTAPYETVCLAAITSFLQPKCVMELGTFKGHNTVLFAHYASPDAEVFTLDLDPGEVGNMGVKPVEGDLKYINKPAIGESCLSYTGSARITQLTGDSMTYDFSPYYGRCDLVFVDAGHSYPFVKADTENAFKMLRPGGVILWHDYQPGCPGVVTALQETSLSVPILHLQGTSLAVFGLGTQPPPLTGSEIEQQTPQAAAHR
jgi:predicted O-methyltransferase YrrM